MRNRGKEGRTYTLRLGKRETSSAVSRSFRTMMPLTVLRISGGIDDHGLRCDMVRKWRRYLLSKKQRLK